MSSYPLSLIPLALLAAAPTGQMMGMQPGSGPPQSGFQQFVPKNPTGNTPPSGPLLETLEWPDVVGSFGNGSAFKRSAILECTGDGLPDAVVQRGHVLTLMYGVAYHEAFLELKHMVGDIYEPIQANDFDVLPEYGGTQQLDSVVVVSPPETDNPGIAILWLEPNDTEFSVEYVTDPAWVGARFVRCADLNSDGYTDIAAVDASGLSVLTKYYDPYDQEWDTGPTASIIYEIIGLELAEWGAGDTGWEIVLDTIDGLRVYDLDGTLLTLLRSAVVDDAMTVMTKDDGTHAVAWITGQPDATGQGLVVVHPTHVEAPVWLPDELHVVALDSADLDWDDDPDLIWSLSSSHEIWAVANQTYSSTGFPGPGSFTLDPQYEGYEVYDTSNNPPPNLDNQAWPVIGDLNLDGFMDCLLPEETEDVIDIFWAPPLPFSVQFSSFPDLEFGTTDCLSYCWDPTGGVLTIEMENSDILQPGFTDVEVIVWEQDNLGLPVDLDTTYANPDAIANCHTKLPLPPSSTGSGCPSVQVYIPQLATLPEESEFLTLYYFEARPVDLTPSSTLDPGRTIVGVFSMDEVTIQQVDPYEDWTSVEFEVFDCVSGQIGGGENGNPVGGFVRGERVPRFPPNSIPRPGIYCPPGFGG